jgi:uncharacterized protein YqeY
MASRLSLSVGRFRQASCAPSANRCTSAVWRKAYSTELSPPPLLSKLKDDLKTAMKAKDTNRLSVLRSVLAATLNASKTDKPITTNAQLVRLLQRTAKKSQEAALEARTVGREDLAEKEEAQQRILEEYVVSGSGLAGDVGDEEVRRGVEEYKARLAAEGVTDNQEMRKRLFSKLLSDDGPVPGSKAMLAKHIKEATKRPTANSQPNFHGNVKALQWAAASLNKALKSLGHALPTLERAGKAVGHASRSLRKGPEELPSNQNAITAVLATTESIKEGSANVRHLMETLKGYGEALAVAARIIEVEADKTKTTEARPTQSKPQDLPGGAPEGM